MCCCIFLFVFFLVHSHQKKNPYTHTYISFKILVMLLSVVVLVVFFSLSFLFSSFYSFPSTTISQKKTSQTTTKSNVRFFLFIPLHMCISCCAPFLLRSMLDFFFFLFLFCSFIGFSFLLLKTSKQ